MDTHLRSLARAEEYNDALERWKSEPFDQACVAAMFWMLACECNDRHDDRFANSREGGPHGYAERGFYATLNTLATSTLDHCRMAELAELFDSDLPRTGTGLAQIISGITKCLVHLRNANIKEARAFLDDMEQSE